MSEEDAQGRSAESPRQYVQGIHEAVGGRHDHHIRSTRQHRRCRGYLHNGRGVGGGGRGEVGKHGPRRQGRHTPNPCGHAPPTDTPMGPTGAGRPMSYNTEAVGRSITSRELSELGKVGGGGGVGGGAQDEGPEVVSDGDASQAKSRKGHCLPPQLRWATHWQPQGKPPGGVTQGPYLPTYSLRPSEDVTPVEVYTNPGWAWAAASWQVPL